MAMKKSTVFILTALLGIIIPSILWASMVSVEIVSDRQGNLPVYPTASRASHTYRAYVEALKGAHYALRVRNNTSARIGVVIAVDGRNIISGEKSFLARTERMYILEPYGSGLYEGWRTGKDQINRFYFTEAPDSYAGAWGDYSAMGVIAMAVFPERRPPEPLHESGSSLYKQKGHTDSMQRADPKRPMAPQPGTGFGEEKYSPAVRVEFEPEDFPSEKHFLKYEWRETLCRKGIIDCSRNPHNRFWDDRGDYTPPPPRYPR
jgi:hypothetical protein